MKQKILRYLITVSFIVLSSPVSVLGLVTSDKSEEIVSSNPEIAGSILITDQPDDLIEKAEKKSVKTELVTGEFNDKSLVALDSNPDSSEVKALARETGSEIKPNYVYKSLFTPNDTNYGAQWNMTKISAPTAWDVTRGDSGVTVAVIDTGVLFEQTIDMTTFTQPDFPTTRLWTNTGEEGDTEDGDPCWTGSPEDKSTNACDDDENGFIDDWQGWDFMGGFRGDDEGCPNHGDATTYQSGSNPNFLTQDNDPNPYSCDSPDFPNILNKDHYNGTCTAFTSACYVGHGTMVASVAAADTDNSALIAGIDHNAKIMNIRALDGYGFSTTARVASAINYAVENGADVINMSLGSNCSNNNFTDSVTETALATAVAAGIIPVAASGNDGYTSSICYPASSSYVIAVGATNTSDNRQSYSNGSNKLDVVAPAGVPVANAPSDFINNEYYSNAHGTSLSTPHVAGQVALIKSEQPNLSIDVTRDMIRNSSDKVSGMGGNNFHSLYGYGRINLYNTIKHATLVHPDGTLIKESNDPKVYLIESNQLRHISSGAALTSHGYQSSHIKPATVSDTQLTDGSSLSFREGTLIKGSGSAVYAVNYDAGTIEKRHVASKSIFDSLGYNSSDVLKVSDALLPASNGSAINSLVHPDGTLIKESNDPKVHLIENNQRRHITSQAAFNSHGFKSSHIKPATVSDTQLTTGSSLSFREGTLLKDSTAPVYVVNYEAGVIEKRHITSSFILNFLYPSPTILKVSNGLLPSQSGDPVN